MLIRPPTEKRAGEGGVGGAGGGGGEWSVEYLVLNAVLMPIKK